MRCKVQHRKAVKATQLGIYLIGGSVRILGYRHWRGGRSHRQRPRDFFGLRINHEHRVRWRFGASAGPSEHVLAVRSDVEVVDTALERDGLDVLKRGSVDNVDAAAR